jgi:hypothetical protein
MGLGRIAVTYVRPESIYASIGSRYAAQSGPRALQTIDRTPLRGSHPPLC